MANSTGFIRRNLQPKVAVRQQLNVANHINKMQPMVVQSNEDMRRDFATRLRELVDHERGTNRDRGRKAYVAKKFEVSHEMARKWLDGESLPTEARAIAMATHYGVRVEWLKSGRGLKTSKADPLFAQLEHLWQGIDSPDTKQEILEFARFKSERPFPEDQVKARVS